MSENTNIEWCDSTFNPFIGCQAVSPGCDNCYAKKWVECFGGDFSARRRTKTWGDPVKWNKQHDAFFAVHGRRQRVFCASLADVFDNEVAPQWRVDLFELIRATPNLDWLLLTKRIGNAHLMIGESLIHLSTQQGMGPTDLLASWPWPNVWIGATICNHTEADRDIPKLLAVPAARRFLSMEPLLGPVEIPNFLCEYPEDDDGAPYQGRIDWVIVGGESGPGARPMHPDWARSLRDQCAAAGVPFLFKQWGGGTPQWETHLKRAWQSVSTVAATHS